MAETVDVTESPAPHEAWLVAAPENFRRIMQNQIASHVTKEVDGITKFSKGNADGRFANSRPVEVTSMSNIHGFHYFVVGATRVGFGAVAAP